MAEDGSRVGHRGSGPSPHAQLCDHRFAMCQGPAGLAPEPCWPAPGVRAWVHGGPVAVRVVGVSAPSGLWVRVGCSAAKRVWGFPLKGCKLRGVSR